MRIVGEWFLCTDGVTRPVVEGFVSLGLDVDGGHGLRRQGRDPGGHRSARVAGAGGEEHEQPGSFWPGEIEPVELGGNGVGVAGGRRRPAPLQEPGSHHRQHDHRQRHHQPARHAAKRNRRPRIRVPSLYG